MERASSYDLPPRTARSLAHTPCSRQPAASRPMRWQDPTSRTPGSARPPGASRRTRPPMDSECERSFRPPGKPPVARILPDGLALRLQPAAHALHPRTLSLACSAILRIQARTRVTTLHSRGPWFGRSARPWDPVRSSGKPGTRHCACRHTRATSETGPKAPSATQAATSPRRGLSQQGRPFTPTPSRLCGWPSAHVGTDAPPEVDTQNSPGCAPHITVPAYRPTPPQV